MSQKPLKPTARVCFEADRTRKTTTFQQEKIAGQFDAVSTQHCQLSESGVVVSKFPALQLVTGWRASIKQRYRHLRLRGGRAWHCKETCSETSVVLNGVSQNSYHGAYAFLVEAQTMSPARRTVLTSGAGAGVRTSAPASGTVPVDGRRPYVIQSILNRPGSGREGNRKDGRADIADRPPADACSYTHTCVTQQASC